MLDSLGIRRIHLDINRQNAPVPLRGDGKDVGGHGLHQVRDRKWGKGATTVAHDQDDGILTHRSHGAKQVSVTVRSNVDVIALSE